MGIPLTRSALATALAVFLAMASSPASASQPPAFRTPSGNIGCMFMRLPGGAALRCDILSGLRPLPKRPASCRLDWGVAVSMNERGRATAGCAGDTVMDPRAPVLRYGATWRLAGFSCISRAAGLTCLNRSGHGWSLSRQHSSIE